MVLDGRTSVRGPMSPTPRSGTTRKGSTSMLSPGGTLSPTPLNGSPQVSPGYRKLRDPEEEARQHQEKMRKEREQHSKMDNRHNSTSSPMDKRARSPLQLERRSSRMSDMGEEPISGRSQRLPRPHTEGPFRRPIRPRPNTAAPPTMMVDLRGSVLGCHTRRTISRASRRSRPASSIDDRKSRGDNGDSDSENEHRTKRDRAPSSVDFFNQDLGPETGWDTDLEQDEPKEEPKNDVKESYDVTGRAIYLESCRKNGVIPASYFLRHMQDTTLEMKHHGLGPTGVKPLAVALVSNTTVTNLNLKDNWLGGEGGFHVCEMLKENCYITNLDLSDNKLGVEFAVKFMDVLNNNSTLTHVTLAGNKLDDRSAVYLSEAIMNSTKLEFVDLSHNHFGEGAGESLGMAISENSSIKHMDLSWNCIRRKGAVAVANGIKNNVLMQKINLSWNGFGNDGASALGDAMKANGQLELLDISNNRINTEGSVLLAKGLAVNESLKVLKMGKNPMQSAGCYAVCAALAKNPNAVMEVIDFTDIMVNSDFLDIFRQLKEHLPDIKLLHGGDAQPKKPKIKIHPMIKLKNYIEKNNLRLVDFFNKFDKDNSMSVTREEFAQGIEETGIKLSPEEVVELLDELDKDGDGEINYSELVIGQKDFETSIQGHSPDSPYRIFPDGKVWKT